MTEVLQTRLVQVAPVRIDSDSAKLSAKPALEAAGIEEGDTVAFREQFEPRVLSVTRVDGSTSIELQTRIVSRNYSITLPKEHLEHLGLADNGDGQLGNGAVYAAEDEGTIALGTDVGPAVEPVQTE